MSPPQRLVLSPLSKGFLFKQNPPAADSSLGATIEKLESTFIKNPVSPSLSSPPHCLQRGETASDLGVWSLFLWFGHGLSCWLAWNSPSSLPNLQSAGITAVHHQPCSLGLKTATCFLLTPCLVLLLLIFPPFRPSQPLISVCF